MTTTEMPATGPRPAPAWRGGSRRRCARSSAATCRSGCAPGTARRPGRPTRREVVLRSPDAYAGCSGTRASSAPPRPTSPASSTSHGDLAAALTHVFAVARERGLSAVGRRRPRWSARSGRPPGSACSGRPPAAPAIAGQDARPAAQQLRDRRAISHHYDLSNDFYALMLDPTMAYSCGYWTSRPTRRTRVGRRAARQARPGLPQARPRARDDACSTSAAAGARSRCTPPSTSARRSPASRSPRSRRGSSTRGSPSAGWPTRSRSGSSDYRDVPEREHYDAVALDRDGRARRRGQLPDVRRGAAPLGAARRPGAGPADVAPRGQQPGGGPFIESLHRSRHAHAAGRRDRRATSRAGVSRCATSTRCVSTTCGRWRPGSTRSRPTCDRVVDLVGRGGRPGVAALPRRWRHGVPRRADGRRPDPRRAPRRRRTTLPPVRAW